MYQSDRAESFVEACVDILIRPGRVERGPVDAPIQPADVVFSVVRWRGTTRIDVQSNWPVFVVFFCCFFVFCLV